MTFSRYVDRWLATRMAERDLDRSAVIEDLVIAEANRGGRQLTAAEINQAFGHLNVLSLVLGPLKLRARHPDDMRAYAEAFAAISAIKRVLEVR